MHEEKVVHSKETTWVSTCFTRTRTEIDGCYAIDPHAERFNDRLNGKDPCRGANWESFHVKKLESLKILFKIEQINKAVSHKGVFRGLHFQYLHPQAKIVECIAGKALVIVMDTRVDSPTFGNVTYGIINPECGIMIYAPEGVAHGFLALENNTRYQYLANNIYRPEEERGITFLDNKIVEIINEITDFERKDIIANERDTNFPTLNQAVKKGDYLPRYTAA